MVKKSNVRKINSYFFVLTTEIMCPMKNAEIQMKIKESSANKFFFAKYLYN